MPTARTAAEILEYHRRSVVALRVLSRTFTTLGVADSALFPRSQAAFDEALADVRDELDDEVVLALVASAERVLRLDYRGRQGAADAAAVRFGHLEQRFDERVPLEEILDVWKDIAGAPNEAGNFKQMYTYRHGLAHGRFFNKSGLHDAAPDDADEVIQELFAAIQGAVPDFPKR
jgi:hypothetical protein